MDRNGISLLLAKYKLNTTSEEERLYIEKLIAEDDSVREEWEELNDADFPIAIMEQARLGGNDLNFQAIEQKLLRSRLRKGVIVFSTAGILIAVLIWTSGIVTRIPKTNKSPTEGGVQLALANGSYIRLDSTLQVVQAGKDVWTNNSRTLKIRSGAGSNISWSTLKVPPKYDYSVQLPDGTTVQVNSVSQLKFPSAFSKTREVYLEGEAFLSVATDAIKPFIVHTKSGDIRVLGTSFNVNAYDSSQITSLVSGKVAIETGGKKVIIHPGQAGTSRKNGSVLVSDFVLSTLSWRTGIYTMDNVPLAEMSKVIERWYDTRVVFDDTELLNLTLSGRVHKNEPLSVFISNISATIGVTCYFKDGVLHMKK